MTGIDMFVLVAIMTVILIVYNSPDEPGAP
jgi:hypothetical protein